MTTATLTPDILDLCDSIRREPDEDVPRLILADAFDALDVPQVECGRCGGKGTIMEREPHQYGDRVKVGCPACGGEYDKRGSGREPHPVHRHAEYIRLSCKNDCEECGGRDGEVGPCGLTNYYRKCYSCKARQARESELLARLECHKPVCPVCDGGLTVSHCDHCKGTGRIGTVVRGMVTLEVPSLDVVWKWKTDHDNGHEAGAYRLTKWAESLRAAYPWVVSVLPLDREPANGGVFSFGWADEADSPMAHLRHQLPAFIFRHVRQYTTDVTWLHHSWHHTPAAAKDALARAVALSLFGQVAAGGGV